MDSARLRVQIWPSWLGSWIGCCWWMAAWLTVTLLTEAHAPDKTTAAFAADLSNWLPTLVDAASGIKLLSCWACKLPLLLLLLWCDGLDTDPWPLSRSCQCSVIRIVFICVPIKKNCDLFHWSWPKTTGNNVLKPKPGLLINFRFFFPSLLFVIYNQFQANCCLRRLCHM